MHAEVGAQVLAALGLDVVDVHLTRSARSGRSQALHASRPVTGDFEAGVELRRLDGIDKADLVSEPPPVAERSDRQTTSSLSVGRSSALKRTRRRCRTEPGGPGRPARSPPRSCPNRYCAERSLQRDVALRLEETPEIGGTTGRGAVKRLLRDRHLEPAGTQIPFARRTRRDHPVEAESAGSPGGVHGLDCRSCRCTPGKTTSSAQVTHASSACGNGHGLDGQRRLVPAVLADEAVRLRASRPAPPRPTSPTLISPPHPGLGAVPRKLVARPELAGRNKRAESLMPLARHTK